MVGASGDDDAERANAFGRRTGSRTSPMDPTILRDRTYLTRLLILKELLARPEAPLREVADALDVTPQAVSQHAKELESDGLLALRDGKRDVTTEGVQLLQEGLHRLKQVVDQAAESVRVVRRTTAEAGTAIRQGQRVGLLMEDGRLVARTDKTSTSMGRAAVGAAAGEEVIVDELSGVVPLEPGRIAIVRLPGVEDGGGRAVDDDAVRRWIEERGPPERVGAIGTGARILARRLGYDVAIEFAVPRAAFHAAELGLTVAVFIESDQMLDALSVLDSLNEEAKRRISVETFEAPKVRL